MDATTLRINDDARTDALACDACGYLRQGLPADALCPECGEPPPRTFVIPRIIAEVRSVAHTQWLRTMAFGMGLLLAGSITALRVTLIMPLFYLTAVAINAPAPKIFAVALLQRPQGGQPGPWGIAGVMSVLCSMIGVWFITEPRSRHRESSDGDIPLRAITRWACIILTGGAIGASMAHYWSRYDGSRTVVYGLLGVLAIVELPVNALLYRHLHLLARRMGDARAASLLKIAMIGIPILLGLGILAGTFAVEMSPDSERLPLAFAAVYGAAGVAIGVIASAGYLRLMASLIARAYDSWLQRFPANLFRRLDAQASALQSVLRRFTASGAPLALGLAGLLLLTYLSAAHGFALTQRQGFGGSLPAMNWLGPKLSALPIFGPEHPYYEPTTDPSIALLLVAVVLLLTAHRSDDKRLELLRRSLRWIPPMLIGAALATGLSHRERLAELTPAYTIAAVVPAFDAPITLLLFIYLSRLATTLSRDDLARPLRRIGWAGFALQLAPLALFAFARPLAHYRWGAPEYGTLFIYGALSLTVTMLALSAIARLILHLLAHRTHPIEARMAT